MKGLDKGPKIELSKLKPGNLKVPGPLQDLWNDLRSQRLLPVVAILLVGLVAIPVLLGGSSKTKPEAGAEPTAVAPSEANPSDLVVSKYAPGLRDYHLRYAGRRAKSPFESPHVSAKGNASKGGEAAATPSPELLEPTEPTGGGSESGAGGESEPLPEETPRTEPGEGSNGGKPNEEQGEESEKAPTDATVDLRVTTLHLDGTSSESARRGVEELAMIPSDTVPALTYVGPGLDGRTVMMAVSSEVTDLLGKSACLVKGEPCQLLALRLGEPETLVFDSRGLTYRIELVRVGTHRLDSEKGNAKGNPAPKEGIGSQVPPAEGNGSGSKLEHLG